MLGKFEFSQNKQFESNNVKTLKTLEARYYNPDMSAKSKLQRAISNKVKETASLRKHDKVRRDPTEKSKLDRIASELGRDNSLCKVDISSSEHERATNMDFNNKMSVNLKEVLRDAMNNTLQRPVSRLSGSRADSNGYGSVQMRSRLNTPCLSTNPSVKDVQRSATAN